MFKYDENALLDTFEVSGNSMDELKEVTDVLTKNTQFMKWHSADIELLSFNDKRKIERDKLDEKGKPVLDKNGNIKKEVIPCVTSFVFTPGNLPSDSPSIPMDSVLKSYRESSVRTPELLKEWTEIVKLAIVFNDNNAVNKSKRFYLTSSNALQTMDRFGMAGEFLTKPCRQRDEMIAKQFEQDLGVTVIARSCNGTKKIFSILSDKYTHIDQSILFDIVKEIETNGDMGEAKCYQWTVSNFFTKLYIEFPKKAKELSMLYGLKKEMIPGILMTTSDTGDSSFKVRGTWRVEGSNSLVVNTEVKRKHIGDINVEAVIEDISNQIFAEYAKLPEALCNLMAHDVTDASWDLTTTAGLKANQAELENVIKTAFKRLGIVKAIGKKTEKKLREALLDEMDVSIHYTAYDIAMSILGLPERVIYMDKEKDISQLQKACSGAPFIKYDVDTSVILTA